MSTIKIQFVRDTSPTESDVEHKDGDVIECNAASADRWIRRKAAIEAGELRAQEKSEASEVADRERRVSAGKNKKAKKKAAKKK